MSTLTLPVSGVDREERVRISVLLVQRDGVEKVDVDGPVRSAVRSAFAHPRLAAPLQALRMDPERLIGRIASRWQSHEHEERQLWEKSNGATTVHWCVDRT